LIADLPPSKSPNYVEFNPERSKILIYKDEKTTNNGVKVPPLLEFDIMNMEFPCEEEMTTCSVP